jgi:hypothetical protein
VYNTSGITSTSQQVNGLNPNTLYYWRVRSASGTTQGFYSVKFSFTTGSSTGIHENADILQMTAFPNPASSFITVSGHMKKSCVLNFRLSDLMGKTVFSQTSHVAQGSFDIRVNLDALPAGAYFLEADSGGEKGVIKVMKQGR